MERVIVWFRKDLRLSDNPCIAEAVHLDFAIVPVFVWNNSQNDPWVPGAASRWWLHKALGSLGDTIRHKSGELQVLEGEPSTLLTKLAQDNQCSALYFGRQYDPYGIAEQEKVQSALKNANIPWKSFNTHLVAEPWENLQENGKGYQVFTRFWKQCRKYLTRTPTPYADSKIRFAPPQGSGSSRLPPAIFLSQHWQQKLCAHWKISEQAGLDKLGNTIGSILKSYRYKRNRPAQSGTSRLSPYLAWGLVSPQRVVQEILAAKDEENRDGVSKFLAELGWREFAYHLLYHQPQITSSPLNPRFANFPTQFDPELFEKWKAGQTGYPMVDAGMRELWETGWMHNRARMLVASFLVKNLLIPWQEGAKWFWDTLVDADLANNSAGWQWSASSGVDYRFRVFNPALQGAKFDAKGEYARKWLPGLSAFSGSQIHAQKREDNQLGESYPPPCVDYHGARKRALELFKAL
jgi:deoxyribodipyrimidine photo-lyase